MDKLTNQLVEKLRKAYGENLVSVVLHGSAAEGDYRAQFSDINVLCVLQKLGASELNSAEEMIRWWRRHGDSAPIFMTELEVTEGAACFAIEFLDMQANHRVLYGKDLISGLAIGRQFYPAQVERELRAKLLRLRQKAAGIISHPDLLRRLLTDSLASFCVLFRHALILRGVEAPARKRETLRLAAQHFEIDAGAFEKLLDVREGSLKRNQVDPHVLLRPYLEGIAGVIARLER